MTLSGLLNTILLLGTLQGFITSILLFRNEERKLSNRLLATLIFLMALASLGAYFYTSGLSNANGIVATLYEFLPKTIIMPVGPLIYFYITSLLDPAFKRGNIKKIHFLPAIIDFVPTITVVIFFAGVFMGLIAPDPAPWGIFIDTFNTYADIPRWLSITMYLWYSIKYVASLKNSGGGASTNIEWINQFLRLFLVFQGICLLYLIFYLHPSFRNILLEKFNWFPVYIPVAVMIYWLGLKGLLIAYSHRRNAQKANVADLTLTPGTIQDIILQLKHSMEVDKLYLNPHLSVTILSQHTGIAQKNISAVLNRQMQSSFNDFVNHYRIEMFKEKIRQPESSHLTMAGVALECGFNSQATFQRVFKELTGTSPSAFRKSLIETGK